MFSKSPKLWGAFAWLLLFLALLTPASWAQPALSVVVTTQDLADITRQIGGQRLQVTALCHPLQDPHFVETKPSYLRSLQRADAFIETGLSLEIGWVPSLLRAARNPKILPGSSNFLEASAGIQVLEKPTGAVDRSRGDIHPDGNPHYLLSPTNAKRVARTITAFLKKIDPPGGAIYDRNYSAYWHALDQADRRWKALLKPYAGQKIVTYHSTWPYFARHFGLEVVGHIEAKPGVAPNSRQLNELTQLMRASHCKAILYETWFPDQLPQALAKRTGAQALSLPIQPGGTQATATYLQMMDYNVQSLVKALQK